MGILYPSSFDRVCINEEIRWETLSPGSDGPAPDADSLLLVSERVRMDLIKSLSFPPTFLRWRGAHGSGAAAGNSL